MSDKKNLQGNTTEAPCVEPDRTRRTTPPSIDRARWVSNDTQRKAVFPVSGGDVTLTFPETMTVGGIEELKDYLDVFLNSKREALLKHGDMEGPA